MPNYRFKCECGKEYERIVKLGTKDDYCECGKIAKKIFTPFRGACRGTFGEIHN